MTIKEVSTKARHIKQLTVDIEARNHVSRIDEPKNLGGLDEGMNPVEALLGALGSCKIIVAKYLAEANGIKINDISIEHVGDIDTEGLAGTNPDAKLGFSKIKAIYDIDADNTKEEIQAFVNTIENTCPVLDTLINTPAFETEIK